ncbi:hypothetical protein APHAL10511_004593 [Amanita phalloides]|nr:hypothetical protein APHAL10511_004593 [Amanita phalloides]
MSLPLPFSLHEFRIAIYKTIGAAFIGFGLACCLYGIVLGQIFGYFGRYPLDRPFYKFLVLFLGVSVTLDQVFIAHTVYWYSITNFSNPLALIEAKTRWSIILQLTTGSISGAVVKTVFGIRVWRFSRRNIFITSLIISLAVGQLGLAVAYTVKAFELPDIFTAMRKLRILGSIALGTGVLTDVVTAAALCFYLNKLRTGYEKSDSLVSTLSRYAINTGIITSATSSGTLIMYNAFPNNNLVFVGLYFITSKLYVISFLATLNTRRIFHGRGTDDEKTNNTNIFHLGTRVPTVGRIEAHEAQWQTGKIQVSPPRDEFPLNSFARPTSSESYYNTRSSQLQAYAM